jgi:hypothetical protein
MILKAGSFRTPRKIEPWLQSNRCPICGDWLRWDAAIFESEWTYRRVCLKGHSQEIPLALVPMEERIEWKK